MSKIVSNSVKKVPKSEKPKGALAEQSPSKSLNLDSNTKVQLAVKEKQCNPCKFWCFTWNNYSVKDIVDLERACKLYTKEYCFGEEVAPSTGMKHLQGFIAFKSRARPSKLKLSDKIHWEVALSNRDNVANYCSKDGVIYTNMVWEEPLDLLDPKDFYEWQKTVYELILTKANKRTINWYWDKKGGCGKSEFAKLLCAKHNAIKVSGKSNDIFCGISKFHEEKKYYPKIVIVDLSRDASVVNYSALEDVKNGHVFSGKYESHQMLFNSPHVIVFANFPPDESKLSADRWVIEEILDDSSSEIAGGQALPAPTIPPALSSQEEREQGSLEGA